jgi:hypothetical protein
MEIQMKAAMLLTTFLGTQARLYPEGMVLNDTPTGRDEAFISMLAVRTPSIAPHVIKMPVDGFKQGTRVGYVISASGIRALIPVLEASTPRPKNAEVHRDLIDWLKHDLLPVLDNLAKKTNLPKSASVTVRAGETQFSAPFTDMQADQLILTVDGRSRTLSMSELVGICNG